MSQMELNYILFYIWNGLDYIWIKGALTHEQKST